MTDTLLTGDPDGARPRHPIDAGHRHHRRRSPSPRADLADQALALLADDLDAIDVACSRFRPDSELQPVEQDGAGRPVAVSPLLFEALEVACTVAAQTAGIVDPTIGSALVDSATTATSTSSAPGPGGRRADAPPRPGVVAASSSTRGASTVAIPIGVHVDLGSTAKALAADRAAGRIAAALGCGVLVNLGGDVAVAGPLPRAAGPSGSPPSARRRPTPSTRSWPSARAAWPARGPRRGPGSANGRRVHHIVDPWTGEAGTGGLVPGVHHRDRAAWRPTPGARPRWCGARTPSATWPHTGCPPAWCGPTAAWSTWADGRRMPWPPADRTVSPTDRLVRPTAGGTVR